MVGPAEGDRGLPGVPEDDFAEGEAAEGHEDSEGNPETYEGEEENEGEYNGPSEGQGDGECCFGHVGSPSHC